MNNIKIIVTGSVGVGKSAVAEFIQRMLEERGIKTSYTNPDGTRSKYKSRNALNHLQMTGLNVDIEEKYIARTITLT